MQLIFDLTSLIFCKTFLNLFFVLIHCKTVKQFTAHQNAKKKKDNDHLFAFQYVSTCPVLFDCGRRKCLGAWSAFSFNMQAAMFMKPVASQPLLNRPADQSTCEATEVDVVMRRCLYKCESACLCICKQVLLPSTGLDVLHLSINNLFWNR